jgi:hypothetical protein
MKLIAMVIYLSSAWPLWQAWRANRRTTLQHALAWSTAAWLAWAALIVLDHSGPATVATTRYLALCLTGCAGIAVLGARAPIAGPWNFVLLGLLMVLLLPWVENVLLGRPLLDPLRLVFVIATLAVGVLNYLPTRLGGTVLVLAVGCGVELKLLLETLGEESSEAWLVHVSRGLIPVACWLGWVMARKVPGASEFDRHWLAFRDRFGLMWGQRVRDQFNRAANNAGWPVWLRWTGLDGGTNETKEMVDTLQIMLKRFGSGASAD